MKTDAALIKEVLMTYKPLRISMLEMVGTELVSVNKQIIAEIKHDVFDAVPNLEVAKSVAETYCERFKHVEEELELLLEWAYTFREGMFLADTQEEIRALLPKTSDYVMYNTLRGTRPPFVKPLVSYWSVLRFLIAVRHKNEHNRVEKEVFALLKEHPELKTKTFDDNGSSFLTEELERRSIPYSRFFSIMNRKVVVPALSNKAATQLIKMYRVEHNHWPSVAEDCLPYIEKLEPDLLHVTQNHVRTMYFLKLKIQDHLLTFLAKEMKNEDKV